MLVLLVALAFAAPELKKDGVYDGTSRIAKIEAKKVPYAGQNVVLTGTDKVVWVNMMVTAVGDGTAMATVEFPTLGRSLGYRIVTGKYEDLVGAWVAAGVFANEGPQLTSLTSWAASATVVVNNTQDVASALAAYAATIPASTYTTPTPIPAKVTETSAPAYQPPASVRVEIYVTCKDKVRLSRGSGGSATYGWESSNSRFSYALSPGSELCICDDRDRQQSCTTVGDKEMRLEMSCTGFRSQ